MSSIACTVSWKEEILTKSTGSAWIKKQNTETLKRTHIYTMAQVINTSQPERPHDWRLRRESFCVCERDTEREREMGLGSLYMVKRCRYYTPCSTKKVKGHWWEVFKDILFPKHSFLGNYLMISHFLISALYQPQCKS